MAVIFLRTDGGSPRQIRDRLPCHAGRRSGGHGGLGPDLRLIRSPWNHQVSTGVISAFPLPADGLNNSANVDMSSEWPLFRQRCAVQGYEVQKVMADLPSLDEAVKKGWLQCDCCAAPMTRHRTAFFCPACGYLRL